LFCWFFLKITKDNGWETYGLELSPDTAKLAQERYGLEIYSGNLEEDTYKSKYFDVITLWDAIEHISNPAKIMQTINHILKDDGIIIFTTPNIDGLFPKASYMITKLIRYWRHPEPPYHLCQFSKKTISKLLDLTGFCILKIYDERIPVKSSFGGIKSHIRYPLLMLHTAFFMPLSFLGPAVNSGDAITVIAKKNL
jgi:SAM-dependent methyltransferase